MSVFKAVNGKYNTKGDLKRLLCYAVNPEHCTQNIVGAQGLLLGDGMSMYQQMWKVKEYFHKEDKRQALHYILSFSKEEEKYIEPEEALRIGYEVAHYFQRWQVVFGVHTNTEHLHIHFVVNCVSYEDGKCISIGIMQLQEIQSYARNRVQQYYLQSLPAEKKMDAIFEFLSS